MAWIYDETELVRVMIRCHATKRAVATGLETTASAWKDRPVGINKVSCPECRRVHAWTKSDAYLEQRIRL
jgi:hypothetical protein